GAPAEASGTGRRAPDRGAGPTPGAVAGAPSPPAHDQLEPPGHPLPDDDRLEQPRLANRRGQLLQRVVVKVLPRLPRIRRDRPNSDLVKIGLVPLRLPRRVSERRTRGGGTRGFAGMAPPPGRPGAGGDQRPKA